MDDLPFEILSRILSYLNLADRRECALTCKRFYEASLDPTLHWRSVYLFNPKVLLSEGYDDMLFYCKSPNLFINGLDENLHVRPLLNCDPSILGPHVLKLSLKGSAILEGSFVDIVKKCEFLEGLDLTACNSMFMAGTFLHNNERRIEIGKVLEGLRDLNLSSIRYLDDESLRKFVTEATRLESLSLASCNISFSDFGISRRHALTFPTFCQSVSMRSSTLTAIDLSRTGITNDALRTFATIKGLGLRKLVLQNCREIGDTGVVDFVKFQRRLRTLDLRGCLEIGNPALTGICTNLHELWELRIAKCRKINDASASRISSSLHELRVLDISECYDITNSIYLVLASLSGLQCLIANGCNFTKLHEQIVHEESKNHSHKALPTINGYIGNRVMDFASLTKLSVNSGKYISDLTVQSIFKYSTNLEDLSMSWCHYITDRGLLGLNVDLSLDKMFPSVDAETEDISGSDTHACLLEKGIGRLRKLKRLALSNCRNITDESLIRIFCAGEPLFSSMEQLELNMMAKSVTDDVLVGISVGCPLLRKLAISCTKVGDCGLDSIASRLRRLESLDLSNCDNITPGFLSILAKNNKWLRELDISSCKQIQAEAAEKLLSSLPLLGCVHTRYLGA